MKERFSIYIKHSDFAMYLGGLFIASLACVYA